jgi:hypothetical protein
MYPDSDADEDPDPAIFIFDLQDANKKLIFLNPDPLVTRYGTGSFCHQAKRVKKT